MRRGPQGISSRHNRTGRKDDTEGGDLEVQLGQLGDQSRHNRYASGLDKQTEQRPGVREPRTLAED
jgi:hypothetical protein